jgi:hypothetical protein
MQEQFGPYSHYHIFIKKPIRISVASRVNDLSYYDRFFEIMTLLAAGIGRKI